MWANFIAGLNSGFANGRLLSNQLARDRDEAYLAPYKNYAAAYKALEEASNSRYAAQANPLKWEDYLKVRPHQQRYDVAKLQHDTRRLPYTLEVDKYKALSDALDYRNNKFSEPMYRYFMQSRLGKQIMADNMQYADLDNLQPTMSNIERLSKMYGIAPPTQYINPNATANERAHYMLGLGPQGFAATQAARTESYNSYNFPKQPSFDVNYNVRANAQPQADYRVTYMPPSAPQQPLVTPQAADPPRQGVSAPTYDPRVYQHYFAK